MLAAALVLVGTLQVEWTIPAEDDLNIGWKYDISAKISGESVTHSRSAQENRVDGEVIPLPAAEPWIWEAHRKPGLAPNHGKRFRDPAEIRLQRLIDYVPPADPIRPRLSWTVQFDEVPIDIAPRAEAIWTIGSDDGDKETLPISYRYTEFRAANGMQARGTGRVHRESGWLLRLDAVAEDAPVPGGVNSGAVYKIKLNLVPRKSDKVSQ